MINSRKKRIALIFPVLFLFVGTLGGFFFYQHLSKEIKFLRFEELRELDVLKDVMMSKLTMVVADVHLMADMEELFPFLSKNDLSAKKDLQSEHQSLVEHKRYYRTTRILDLKGNEKIRMDYNGKFGRPASESELQKNSLAPYFSKLINLGNDDVYLHLDNSKDVGETKKKGLPFVIDVGKPIYDNERKKVGAIVLSFSWDQINAAIDRSQSRFSGNLILIDGNGMALSGALTKRESRSNSGGTILDDYPQAWQVIRNQDHSQFVNSEGTFSFETIPMGVWFIPSIKEDGIQNNTDQIRTGNTPDQFIKVVSHIPPHLLIYRQFNSLIQKNIPVFISLLLLVLLGTYLLDQIIEAKEKKSKDLILNAYRLNQINECVKNFTMEFDDNIHKLMALTNHLLGGSVCFVSAVTDHGMRYFSTENSSLQSVNCSSSVRCFCIDLIQDAQKDTKVMQDLTGAAMGPCVQFSQIQTYIGTKLKRYNESIGVLGVGYRNKYEPNAEDLELMRILAGSVCAELIKQADIQTLKNSEEKYRGLVDTSNDGIISIDSEMKIVLWNKGAERIFGHCEGDILGKNIEAILPEKYRHITVEIIRESFKKTGVAMGNPVELVALRKSGKEISIELLYSNLPIGSQIAGTAFVRDISEKKRMMGEREQMLQQLIKNEKLSSLGEMAAGVAHELNTPLNVIMGNIQLLQKKIKLGPEQAEYLAVALESIEQCRQLVGDVLLFSRGDKSPDRREIINIDDSISSALKLLGVAKSPNIKLLLDLKKSLPLVLMDKKQLTQIMVNIIKNAVQAMPDGGELKIMTDCKPNETAPRQEVVEVKVIDNGEGISSENLGKVFDPFYTTRRPGKGTGLGLSICYRLLEQVGGDISMISHVGRGTEVVIKIPAAMNTAGKS